jgi:hypothetical protein
MTCASPTLRGDVPNLLSRDDQRGDLSVWVQLRVQDHITNKRIRQNQRVGQAVRILFAHHHHEWDKKHPNHTCQLLDIEHLVVARTTRNNGSYQLESLIARMPIERAPQILDDVSLGSEDGGEA